MDPNLSSLLMGIAGTAALGIVAWFFKRFWRWPIGDEAPSHFRGPSDFRMARVEAGLSQLTAEFAGLRQEIGTMREDIGELRGELRGRFATPRRGQ